MAKYVSILTLMVSVLAFARQLFVFTRSEEQVVWFGLAAQRAQLRAQLSHAHEPQHAPKAAK